ncbi:MAG: hypothetical protein NT062_18720 [Proteobacteria bacterium]|nr:hypothetical protein [Pseudomonadota bacterium]
MRLDLDPPGVAELAARFGDLHDAVIRGVNCAFDGPARIELDLDVRALDGSWWQLTIALRGVSEFRLAEGVAIWGDSPTWDVTTHHPDGHATHETRVRDYGDLALGGPTNQVIYGAAIHLVSEGIFVDLAPADLGAVATTDPAAWRRSTFYVFARTGVAVLVPLP